MRSIANTRMTPSSPTSEFSKPFHVKAILGETAHSLVSLGTHPNLHAKGEMVTVKTIKDFSLGRHFSSPADAPTRRAVEEGLAVLRRLRHPNIVHVLEVIDDPLNNCLNFVSQHVAKRPLLQQLTVPNSPQEYVATSPNATTASVALEIANKTTYVPVEESAAGDVAVRLIHAVRYLHRHGVVHCAIKPSNVMTDDEGTVYLCDAGGWRCSFLHPRLDVRHRPLATPLIRHRQAPWSETQEAWKRELCPSTNLKSVFVAPELWMSGTDRTSSPNPIVDVWSLGVFLYTMVTGRIPHGLVLGLLGQRAPDGVHLPMPKNVSGSLIHCLRRMIVVNPAQRATLEEIREHPFFKEAASRVVARGGRPLPLSPSSRCRHRLRMRCRGLQFIFRMRRLARLKVLYHNAVLADVPRIVIHAPPLHHGVVVANDEAADALNTSLSSSSSETSACGLVFGKIRSPIIPPRDKAHRFLRRNRSPG